jgi:hypothetical protein
MPSNSLMITGQYHPPALPGFNGERALTVDTGVIFARP